MTETLKVKLNDEQVAYIIYKVTEKMMLDSNRIEVVRCENCKYYVTNYAVPHCGRTLIGMKKSDYCSYGERR